MKRADAFILSRIALAAFTALLPVCVHAAIFSAAPAPAIPLPVIARRVVSVQQGAGLETKAIQKAIDACASSGGGVVDLPAGRYRTGPLTLAGGIDLRLESGAILQFMPDRSLYPLRSGRYADCITAEGCHDVAITGSGTIDGSGAAWWPDYAKGMPPAPHRPYLVSLRNCTRVLVSGVTLRNSPSFHLVPDECADVTIRNIHIDAPADSPNTDGCDPSGWHYLIAGCTFDVGDDCIAVKPGRVMPDGKPSCADILIEDCAFLHGHGLSVGGQTRGGLDGMRVVGCTFDGTLAGIRMKSSRGAGGLVRDVVYEHLRMTHVRDAIVITSYYPKIPQDPSLDKAQPIDSLTPVWRNIAIRDVVSTNGVSAGEIIGLPEMPVTDITLTDVTLRAATGLRIVNASGVRLTDSQIVATSGPPLIVRNATLLNH